MAGEVARAESNRKNHELVVNVTTVGGVSSTRDQSNVQRKIAYREGGDVKGAAATMKEAAPTVSKGAPTPLLLQRAQI
ncbi:hypothetical protein AMTR_s00116p00135560 [Amborella trichopoda]|uniref:Uncharacterized protein n=1 Tax=Amborella trichopoda TaxID=13333 RepID=W1NPZ2_AMBTC|nr:hypothetical protein AMTR_s00116p00135560 [Amborella trichopoda]